MRDRLTVLAPAKINPYLEIRGRRPDGYHELAVVFQAIGLADRVTVERGDTEAIRLRCDDPDLPTDGRNLAWQAAQALRQQFPDLGGIHLTLEKRIPAGAGLAGGSADAAAVLVAGNLLWDLGLTVSELAALGATLGADVAFCVMGGTALGTGRGEILSPLPATEGLTVVVAKPRHLSVATPEAYRIFREEGLLAVRSGEQLHRFLGAWATGQPEAIAPHLFNDLERAVLPRHPEILALKNQLMDAGAIGALMSGSGSAVFGLVPDADAGHRIAQACSGPVDFWVTHTYRGGIAVVA
ncbi:MAG: 4-(cytidine 5'-diphospho)-2-C-methyl-D-erythritol kinase [Oscillatoriales cyanobacterium SM2_1_8]|nr:4-(cytidine 5'-diphospho)-2-C-methyl-D-erythritol kinase [Oscillatoriales cyanobacterium SM2_1_8]